MIKFPRIHIAESVTNRILNLADGLPDARQAGQDVARDAQAYVPDAQGLGRVLDQKLAQAPATGATMAQAPDPGATLEGENLLTTFTTPGR